jgi:hypothetical protein
MTCVSTPSEEKVELVLVPHSNLSHNVINMVFIDDRWDSLIRKIRVGAFFCTKE